MYNLFSNEENFRSKKSKNNSLNKSSILTFQEKSKMYVIFATLKVT